jgi:hypothetical protein
VCSNLSISLFSPRSLTHCLLVHLPLPTPPLCISLSLFLTPSHLFL